MARAEGTRSCLSSCNNFSFLHEAALEIKFRKFFLGLWGFFVVVVIVVSAAVVVVVNYFFVVGSLRVWVLLLFFLNEKGERI